MKRVLILTIATPGVDRTTLLTQFVDGLNTSKQQFEFAVIQDVIFKIVDGKLSVTLHRKELHERFDTLHLRNHNNYTDLANALRLYADAHNIYVVNRADACLPYYGKTSQGMLLAIHGVPTPDLISTHDNQVLEAALDDAGWSYPFVVKHNTGIRGVDNHLVRNRAELGTILAQPKQSFLAQPFIANRGELRVLTFGPQLAPLVFQKTAVPGTYLNNTSQGGEASWVELHTVPETILEHAKQAAQLMGRDIAGVDVLLANDGSYSILEVNSTPAIATGVYLDEKRDLYRQYFETLDREAA